MNNTIPSILYTESEIAARVKTLAEEIAAAMPQEILIVSLLRGSFMFTADLIRELYHQDFHPKIDFMTLQSYGTGTQSSGKISVNRDITEDVSGLNVLIVDDILESGQTLTFARNLLNERGARSVKICVLLEKPGKRKVPMEADFVGFVIPDKFVVGYGLDHANNYREMPFIGILD